MATSQVGVADKRRILAAFIDNALSSVVCLLSLAITPAESPAANVALVALAYVSYFLAFEASLGRTPGKMLNGLAVTKITGEPCGLREALLRSVPRLLETNPLLLGGLPAALAILVSRRKQRWGDMLARTLVVPSRE
jgi:uncharacterized RDD family membrane protein YckC